MSRTVRWFFVGVMSGLAVLSSGWGAGGAKERPDPAREPGPGRGNLRGQVLVGDPRPDLDALNRAYRKALEEAKTDKEHCVKREGENQQQTWIIGANGGLANVFVWVAPPDGRFFELDKKDLDLKALGIQEVIIDQPHCLYTPRAVWLFPSYHDPLTLTHKPTGQTFKVKNSGTLNHNTYWHGVGIRGDNKAVPPNLQFDIPPTQVTASGLKPSPHVITISCQVHGWMRAFVRSYDHPFVAVTGKDGSFAIKNVPALAEVRIMYWHESMDKPMELQIARLKEGDNEVKILIGGR